MTKSNGYPTKQHKVATKRYCQTMNLKQDSKLIEEYKNRHKKENIWKEIVEGIKSVGILEMEIYLIDNKLFMIVETPEDFNWDIAMAKLATLPRQQEWEDYMAIFQDTAQGISSAEKWQLMERIFNLYE